MSMKTWVKELLLVNVILWTIFGFAGAKPIEILGTLAVIVTFCYVQVATRLDEAMTHCDKDKDNPKIKHAVYCRAWLNRYLLFKETLWLSYFVALGAWSALGGVIIMLSYPLWRAYHKSRRKPKEAPRRPLSDMEARRMLRQAGVEQLADVGYTVPRQLRCDHDYLTSEESYMGRHLSRCRKCGQRPPEL